jgi:prepilin peptidase CpaA
MRDPYLLAWLLGCLGMLGAAVWTDLRAARIPNGIVAAGLALAVMLSLTPQGGGLDRAVGGAVTGLSMLLPLYMLGVSGAGDAKLLTAVGAFVGFPAILGVALTMFVAGGVLAIGWALHARLLRESLRNLRDGALALMAQPSLSTLVSLRTSPRRIPYSLAIAVGALLQIWLDERFAALMPA